MMIQNIRERFHGYKVSGILIFILGFIFIQSAQGQPEKPPRPISIAMYQNLSFGSVILGFTEGTVSMSANGIRSVSGGLILQPGSPGNAAVFEVKAPPGTLIRLFLPPKTQLSNGKTPLVLNLDSTDPPGLTFITTRQQGQINLVHVGGTLLIPANSSDLPGSYIGSFTLTVIQE
jgi:hypothetical protein